MVSRLNMLVATAVDWAVVDAAVSAEVDWVVAVAD
jgi:hypothetical protein